MQYMKKINVFFVLVAILLIVSVSSYSQEKSGGIFDIQNYEFSVPVRYDFKHFMFIFLPVYPIPVNPATNTDNLNTYQEDTSNIFFWSIGVLYKFFKQKTK